MQFVIDPRNTAMDEMYQNGAYNFLYNQFGNKSGKWQHQINLSEMPTQPEDLNLKMEADILSVTGRSEVTRERPNGLTVFSTHIWSKQLKMPEMVDRGTLSAKMRENILMISAKFKKDEIDNENEFEIPIEKLD